MRNDFERVYRKTMRPGYNGFLRGLCAARALATGQPVQPEPGMLPGLQRAQEIADAAADADAALIMLDELLLTNFLEDQPDFRLRS